MAKLAKSDTAPAQKPSKAAMGKLTPKQADKLKHKADAVLGKHDSAYHNC